jgi:hypothetical protein
VIGKGAERDFHITTKMRGFNQTKVEEVLV